MAKYHVTYQIALRADILDPAGRAVEARLSGMGKQADNVRIGKHITLDLEAENTSAAEQQAHQIAGSLLVNAVMEDYTITLCEKS